LEAADEGLIVFERGGHCRLVGRRLGELFGTPPSELVGRSRATVLGLLSEACEEPNAFLDALGPNDMNAPPHTVRDIELRKPRVRTIVWTSFPVVVDGAVAGRAGIVRDVTRERSAERSLKQLQMRVAELTPVDVLTGLPNLRRFREDLEREHGRSARAWDCYAVLHIDVAAMSAINDELGVPIGDRVLETVAERLKYQKREYDVVARGESDSFLVLLPGADAVAARTVAVRMQKSVAEFDFQLADARKVSVTVGGAVWRAPSADSCDRTLERAADASRRAHERSHQGICIDDAEKKAGC
jgi:diguanylate cyclase (GGDEF)-like protein